MRITMATSSRQQNEKEWSLMTKLEDDLRHALARIADVAPSGASERLRLIDYHPKSPRLRPLLIGSGVCIAGLVAIALSLVGLGAGTQRAFAGWAAAPTTPEAGQVAAAKAACAKE